MGDQPFRGVLYMIAAVAGFSIVDLIGKFQAGSYPTFQLLFLRAGGTLILTLAAVHLFAAGQRHWTTTCLKLQIARGIIWAAVAVLFFVTFMLGTMTWVYLVTFSHPIFAIFLASLIRKKKPKYRAFMPIALMFVAVIIGTLHEDTAFEWTPFLLGSITAVFFALEMVLTAKINDLARGGSDSAATTLLYSSLAGTLIFGGTMLAAGEFGAPVWIAPTAFDWAVILLASLACAAANFGFNAAYKHASEGLLAPFDYTILIFGAFFDWAVFGDGFRPEILLVAALLGAGGYWLYKEQTK